MRTRSMLRRLATIPLAAAMVLLAAGAPGAAEYWLRAEVFTSTMPDGRAVTMWGYVLDQDGDFGTLDGLPTVPGPALAVPPGEGLTVHLYNNGLPEGVSLVISGQQLPSDGVNPIQVTRSGGRITGFTHEAAPGSSADYVWSNLRPGTFLYQSGSHPALQVQMGLYGAVKKDAAVGNAYGVPETAYAGDLVLLFSEIDPALHDAVAAGQYGPGLAVTSTMYYDPQYFLVNGRPYSPALSPTDIGLAPGSSLLLRFLNAGLESHLPVVQGTRLTMVAEDGFVYPYPRLGETAELPAGKTVDALMTVPPPGIVAVYDRALKLTNGTVSGGGMLTYLRVPSAAQNTVSVTKVGTGTGRVVVDSAPGGIDCGADCSESYDFGSQITLRAYPDPGSLLVRWTGACLSTDEECVVNVDSDAQVVARFSSYTAVRLVSPANREVWPAGSLQTIRWGAPATAVSYNLAYSLNGGTTWRVIDRGIEGNSYVWELPTPNATRTNCFVRVRAYNANGAFIDGDTNNLAFTITVP